MECQQLVLDVSEGCRIQLAHKEAGCRSQLWCMTSQGMLQHEGSSPPHDPTSKKPRDNTNILVITVFLFTFMYFVKNILFFLYVIND